MIFQKIAYPIHQIYSRRLYTPEIRPMFQSALIGALHVPLQGMAPPAIPCSLFGFPDQICKPRTAYWMHGSLFQVFDRIVKSRTSLYSGKESVENLLMDSILES
jgi:hypothetical protein